MKKYICRICGYEFVGELNDTVICPVCNVGTDFFKEVTASSKSEPAYLEINSDNCAICRDASKCVNCGNCKSVCKYKQTVYGRFNNQKCKSLCIDCGQCSIACPSGAIDYKSDYQLLQQEMSDESKTFVFITAPATRVSLAEAFGEPEGTICTEQLVGALRALGADYVFDATFGADLTIIEEANELVSRLKSKIRLPMFTSCCPSWVKFAEIFYPQMLKNLSTCLSPLSMHGEIIKTYWAKKKKISPDNVRVVAITPCTAKKAEAAEKKHFDYAIPIRELKDWLVESEICFKDVELSEFDELVGNGSGAGVIFGSSGGVMEAVLRTAHQILTGEAQQQLFFSEIRNLDGLVQSEVSLGGYELKVAAVSGLANVRKLMDRIKKGEHFDFVEVMACLGGCIAGGGQPKNVRHSYEEIRKMRSNALYQIDETSKIRSAHENPEVKNIYNEFLIEAGNDMLHTKFNDKSDLLG